MAVWAGDPEIIVSGLPCHAIVVAHAPTAFFACRRTSFFDPVAVCAAADGVEFGEIQPFADAER